MLFPVLFSVRSWICLSLFGHWLFFWLLFWVGWPLFLNMCCFQSNVKFVYHCLGKYNLMSHLSLFVLKYVSLLLLFSSWIFLSLSIYISWIPFAFYLYIWALNPLDCCLYFWIVVAHLLELSLTKPTVVMVIWANMSNELVFTFSLHKRK